jgi:hypothetical protein
MGNRQSLDIAPFVAMWHPLVARIERTAGQGQSFNSAKEGISGGLQSVLNALFRETGSVS